MNKVQITLNDGYEFSRVEVDIGRTYDLPGEGLKRREGREFLGWYTLPDGGDLVSSVMASKSDTYYARYSTDNCTLTFIDDYSHFSQTMVVQHGSTPSQFPVLKRAGYKFLGWWHAEENNYQSETQVSESLQIYTDMTFHAHWEAINYRVEWYFLNCAKQSEEEDFLRDFAEYIPSLTLSETRNLAQNSDPIIDDIILAKREWTALLDDVDRHNIHGWQVARWEVVEPNFDLEDGTYTIKCYWEKATYTIQFNSNGGSINSTFSTRRERKYGDKLGSPGETEFARPSKVGYTFRGWKFSGDSVDVNTIVRGNMTITAEWEMQQVTVMFDPQGGIYTVGTSTIQRSDEYRLTLDYNTSLNGRQDIPSDPQKTEWHFTGWCTDPNGAGSKVDISNIILNPPHKDDGNYDVIRYYATYHHNYRNITFDANGGRFSSFSSIQFTGEKITQPATRPEKPGYVFDGWYKTPTNQTSELSATDVVDEDATYYAKWSEDEIEIIFNSNGGH